MTEPKTLRFDVEGYVSDRIGIRQRAEGKNGPELISDCPFCDGRLKLYANSRTGMWTCYKCGEGGPIVKLVELVDGLSRHEAARFVRRQSFPRLSKTVGDLRSGTHAGAVPEPERDGVELPSNFVPVFNRDTSTWVMPTYLRDRGIRARTAAAYRLGSCLEGCGRDCRRDNDARRPCEACRYVGRVICPAHVNGVITTFQGRSMDGSDPKYLAPPTERGSTLYGLDEACGNEEVAVVEGPFDVLGMAQAYRPAVALLGKVAFPAQAVLLRDFGVERVIVLLDPEASVEAHHTALVLGELLDVRIATLPRGMDPGDAPPEEIGAALARARPPSIRGRFKR